MLVEALGRPGGARPGLSKSVRLRDETRSVQALSVVHELVRGVS